MTVDHALEEGFIPGVAVCGGEYGCGHHWIGILQPGQDMRELRCPDCRTDIQ